MKTNFLQQVVEECTALESAQTDGNGILTHSNESFARHVLPSAEGLVGRPIFDFLVESDGRRVGDWLKGDPLPEDWTPLSFVTAQGSVYTLRCLLHWNRQELVLVGEPDADNEQAATEDLLRLNNEITTLARERTREKRELQRAKDALSAALEELETSYWHLKKIQEVLPVCLRCGRVKTSEATWQSVIDFLADNSLFMSHGYCPPCAERYLEELDNEQEPE